MLCSIIDVYGSIYIMYVCSQEPTRHVVLCICAPDIVYTPQCTSSRICVIMQLACSHHGYILLIKFGSDACSSAVAIVASGGTSIDTASILATVIYAPRLRAVLRLLC